MNADMTTGTGMSFLDNLTAATAVTPACAAVQQVQPLEYLKESPQLPKECFDSWCLHGLTHLGNLDATLLAAAQT